MSAPRRKLRAGGFGVLALIAVTIGLTACDPPKPAAYVALGDSFTAGPLILDQSLSPLGCLRSNRNYPHIVAPSIKTTSFTDVSCSGATTKDMFTTQGVTPGPNPPQLDAIDASTKVVTLQIGGNDIGFSGIITNCAALTPWSSGCKGDYVTGGRDQLADRVAATAPKIDSVLAGIAKKAPQAKVFVLGYPAILPESGGGCWPSVPIVSNDVSYLRGVEKNLNAMIKARAQAAGATYVDIYTPSIGHDACSSSRWVEPIIPGTDAAPVHPNATGMRGFGVVTAAAINKVVTA